MDRRDFVTMAGGALAGGVLAGCAALVATPVTPVDGKIRLALRNYPALAEPGGGLKLQPRGAANPLYVVSQDDGTVAALSPVCTHLHCIVDLGRETLICPCHGSTYDRAGRVLKGPAELPLKRFPTSVSDDGVLVIDLGAAE